MKTLDEVIEMFTKCTSPVFECRECSYCTGDEKELCNVSELNSDVLYYLKMYRSDKLQWEADKKAYEDERQKAIHATKKARERYIALAKDTKDELAVLRDFWAESQANPPLTWDELKSMEGKPVWVEYGCDFNQKRWVIIGSFHGRKNEFQYMDVSGGYPNTFWEKEMGADEFWQAYRKERS